MRLGGWAGEVWEVRTWEGMEYGFTWMCVDFGLGPGKKEIRIDFVFKKNVNLKLASHTLWAPLGPYGARWVRMGPYVPIWAAIRGRMRQLLIKRHKFA